MKIVTATIDDNGDILFLKSEGTKAFCSLGKTTTRRASHILPCGLWLRLAFRAVRLLSFDDSAATQWTREWNCTWYIDARPVGGELLSRVFYNRQDAILAEIEYINLLFVR